MPDRRSPHNGEPYYCETCGLGFGEYMACDEFGCRLESREVAQARKAEHDAQEQIPAAERS